MHAYNTTGTVSVARRAAEAVLRGPQDHVASADGGAAAAPRRDLRRAAGLADRAARGRLVAAARRGGAGLDAGGGVGGDARGGRRGDRRCAGWGADVAARYVRFVFSAEPVARLATLGERLRALACAMPS